MVKKAAEKPISGEEQQSANDYQRLLDKALGHGVWLPLKVHTNKQVEQFCSKIDINDTDTCLRTYTRLVRRPSYQHLKHNTMRP
jgi:hypothetical protein